MRPDSKRHSNVRSHKNRDRGACDQIARETEMQKVRQRRIRTEREKKRINMINPGLYKKLRMERK